MSDLKWTNYEEVAAYIIEQLKNNFGLSEVKRKQKFGDTKSGAIWNLDAIGLTDNDGKFVIIECKRYTTSKIKQEQIAGLAFRIKDTGAQGGIIVSPLGLQKGALQIANAENIKSIQIDPMSTKHDYFVKFLEDVMLGVSDRAFFVEGIEITKT